LSQSNCHVHHHLAYTPHATQSKHSNNHLCKNVWVRDQYFTHHKVLQTRQSNKSGSTLIPQAYLETRTARLDVPGSHKDRCYRGIAIPHPHSSHSGPYSRERAGFAKGIRVVRRNSLHYCDREMLPVERAQAGGGTISTSFDMVYLPKQGSGTSGT
jgi:hypothetical protein